MKVRFWGTRGSIAKAGPSTVRYGGNTSCVEVRSAAGDVLVLDCGTGAHGLGVSLVREGIRRGHVLISHTHWDHIQGLPFFAPLFVGGNQWDVYGPRGLGPSLGEVLAGQMEYTYFPISPKQFEAAVAYHDLVEGSLEIGDIRVTTRYLNHPALTLAYRIECDGVTVVYATDHEPHDHRLACGGAPALGSDDERHGQFLAGADLVIHDTQYTATEYPRHRGWGHSTMEYVEYPRHRGWGHSTMEYVVDLARAGAVCRLAMFHHD
ncbi:MAG: MBL fold metallo-hydrolase, partial [Myxococcales bacterium]|nr:MBL fold metallo-hydrolase [Myxococcales bacterium]